MKALADVACYLDEAIGVPGFGQAAIEDALAACAIDESPTDAVMRSIRNLISEARQTAP